MLTAPSQCLLRNKLMLDSGKWLLVNPTDVEVFSELSENVEGFHQYFDIYSKALPLNSERHHFGFEAPEKKYDGIVFYISKAKQHTETLLRHLATRLNNPGQLLILGENKGGIKSSAKFLENVGSKAQKIDSARHCALLGSLITEPDSGFQLADSCSWFECEVNEIALEVASTPGTFSHNELDLGTKLLLEHVAEVPNGKLLDFACGNGVIASYLAKSNPESELYLSDINANALYCAQKTLDNNGIEATIIASDGLAQVNEQFAAIYTNPPFHTGIKTDHHITSKFLRDAVSKLEQGGTLTLVANRFLPYPDQMQDVFGNVRKLAENSKFSLYQSTKN